MTSSFPIVGIGASAGGIEALEAFFTALPAQSGMGFVVVTHLSPDHASHLPEIIARHTPIPVAAAADGQAVAPDHVYVLPPGGILTIADGRLRLRPRVAGDALERLPIDIFFTALAEDAGERAIGVVLSGSGTDGARGVTAIKASGGLTLAQGPDGGPRFPDMPDSAVATGHVDLTLPVEAIPARLVELAATEAALDGARLAAVRQQIFDILRTRLGHDFSQYKDRTFARRLQRRLQVLQLPDIDAYVERLRADRDECLLLFRDLLIGVTAFFRDPGAFEALASLVIPRLFEGRAADQEVRVWVAGCSTGEEAYSIAILLMEHAATLPSAPKLQVFATDIDERALATARAGRYPAGALETVSPARRARFFESDGTTVRVTRALRELCIFSPHSIFRDPPFSRLDLIACRNLLIYFKPELQSRIVPLFHYALRPGGCLFLGPSETVARHGDLFTPLDKQHRLYGRRDLVTPLARTPPPRAWSGRRATTGWAPGTVSPKPDMLQLAATAMSEQFAPAHVVVNEAGEVLHYSLRTGRYLEAPAGAPSRDLLSLARKELRFELRAVLRQAVETRRPATGQPVPLAVDGGATQLVGLAVQPLGEGSDIGFLVVFTDIGLPVPHDETAARPALREASVADLVERELQEIRERLQATIEELETANEELKSSNEELVSLNEELQSANEELEASKEETQSINEELQSVNAELQAKVVELDRASSDLRSVFESTGVGLAFLDKAGVVRTFTQPVTRIFNLLPSDQGRPLTDLVSRLDGVDLKADIDAVLGGERVIERRVRLRAPADAYLMRVLPYRTTAGAIDGVLLTFTDITNLQTAEDRQRLLTAELSHRIKNTLTVVISLAQQTADHAPDLAVFLGRFLDRLRALAATHELLSLKDWTRVGLRDLIVRALGSHAAAATARLDGPDVALQLPAAVPLGMVIHELTTNAIKHGAFSVHGGSVDVGWRIAEAAPGTLALTWRERDGPVPAPVPARGFGTTLVEDLVRYELQGSVALDFDPAGLRCTMTIPLGRNVLSGEG